MNLMQRFRLAGKALSSTGSMRNATIAEASELKRLREETEGFTMLGGSPRDLAPYDQQKMRDVALRLYRGNHMAKRLLDINVDFVFGEGWNLIAKHDDERTREAIQDVLDAFWFDPVNDMDRNNPQRFIDEQVWGDILIPVKTDESTGDIRLGWIDTQNIKDVVLDPVTQRPGKISLTSEAARDVGMDTLEVIRYDADSGEMVGNVIYDAINTTAAGWRGVSEYYPAADWFDVLDETMKSTSDRAKLSSYFIWDVEMEGASQEEIDAFVKAQKAPKPNSLRVHNDRVKWKALAPSINAYEAGRHVKDLKSHLTGGYGLPAHWFGDGSDANLATASVMSEPTRKALRRKTRQFTYVIRDIVRFLLTQKVKAGVLDIDPLADVFVIDVPDIGGSDVAKVGSAMQTVTSAVVQAKDSGMLSEATARRIFSAVASLTGVDVDPVEEGIAVESDAKATSERDDNERKAAADLVRDELKRADSED